MLHRTLTLELASGKSLKLRSTSDGMEVTLGKAKTLLTSDEIKELQGAIAEVGRVGFKPQPAPIQKAPIQKMQVDDDLPINPQ